MLFLSQLGAGLGLCGILAHRMTSPSPSCSSSSPASESNTNINININTNTTEVFLTDGDTDALVQLRENVERNKSKTDSGEGNNNAAIISCHQLLWGRQTAMDFLERQHHHGQTQTQPLLFDVVLASDVIYVADIIPPLWETIQSLLTPNGVFLLAYAKRKVPVSFALVLSAAEEAGFSHECLQDNADADADADADDGLYLYAFRWKNDDTACRVIHK
jgi:predicted nicotinamide N-methyase